MSDLNFGGIDHRRRNTSGEYPPSQLDLQKFAEKVQRGVDDLKNSVLDLEKENVMITEGSRARVYPSVTHPAGRPSLEAPIIRQGHHGIADSTLADSELDFSATQDAFMGVMSKVSEMPESDFKMSDEAYQKGYSFLEELSALELPESTGNALFDMYAMIALLLQASQKLRDAAREIRLAENQAIQKTIQNQADLQSEAATNGMWTAIGCGVLQFAAQAICLRMQVKYSKQQVQHSEKFDINSLRSEWTALKSDERNINQAIKTKEGNLQVQNAEVIKDVKKDESQNNVFQNDEQIDTTSQKRDLDPNNQKTEKSGVERRIDDPILDKRCANNSGNGQGENNGEPSVKQLSNDELEKKSIEELKELQAKYKDDIKTKESLISDKEHERQYGHEMIHARSREAQFKFGGDIAAALGSGAQNAFRGWADLKQADATREGADLKRQEEGLDQIKDLFALAEDVIRKVLELYNSIYQVETSSMQEAIRA